MHSGHAKSDRPQGRWWKVLLFALVIILLGLAVAIHQLNAIALSQINRALNRYFVAGGSLDRVHIRLAAGRIRLDGLTIHAPEGSGGSPLLTLDSLDAELNVRALLYGELIIEGIVLSGGTLLLARDKTGQFSFKKLIVNEKRIVADASADTNTTRWSATPTIRIRSIRVNNLTIRLMDEKHGRPWATSMQVNLDVADLQPGNLLKGELRAGAFDLVLRDIEVDQPPGFDGAPLLMAERIELAAPKLDLGADHLKIGKVRVVNAMLSVAHHAEGKTNLQHLLNDWKPSKSATQRSTGVTGVPRFSIDDVQLQSVAVNYQDYIQGQSWRAGFDGMQATVKALSNVAGKPQDLSVDALTVELRGLSIDQPPGFATERPTRVERLMVAANRLDTRASELTFERVSIEGLVATLVRNAKGETNLQRLLAVWKPAGSGETRPPSGNPPAAAGGMAMLTFDDIQLLSMALEVVDVIGGQRWRAGWEGMDISATEVTVGDLARREIEAGAFRLQLHGTEVDPPPGSELDKLARLEDLTLATKAVDLASPEIVVDQLHMAGLNASIQIDAKGVSNLQKLKAGLLGGSRSASDGASPKKRVARSSNAQRALPVIHLDQVRLENGALDYRQSSVDGTAYAFPMKNIRLEAAGLRLFDDLAMAAPASLSLSYKIKQPDTLPDAHYGAVAAIGRLGADVPSLNAQICYTGVKLETLGSLIPTGTRTTLNANGFDARLSLSLDEKAVNLYGTVTSDAGIRYDAIHIQGPLKAPKVEMGPIVAGVFSQVSGDMLNLGKGGLDAGTSVVESGVDVAAKAGSGTWEIGKNIGGNLLTIGTGLFTMDHRKMQKGLLGTTTGTLERTVDSVADTGKAAVGGLEKSVSSLSGDDETARAWDQGIADRHRVAMQQARSALAQMPYPPVTE